MTRTVIGCETPGAILVAHTARSMGVYVSSQRLCVGGAGGWLRLG
jgi:hypothetical protein